MGISTFDEATRPGGTGYVNNPCVVTFYKFDCPKCYTLNVGDDMCDNWREGQPIQCKCGYEAMPDTRKVDLVV